jgi:hypothetical protein
MHRSQEQRKRATSGAVRHHQAHALPVQVGCSKGLLDELRDLRSGQVLSDAPDPKGSPWVARLCPVMIGEAAAVASMTRARRQVDDPRGRLRPAMESRPSGVVLAPGRCRVNDAEGNRVTARRRRLIGWRTAGAGDVAPPVRYDESIEVEVAGARGELSARQGTANRRIGQAAGGVSEGARSVGDCSAHPLRAENERRPPAQQRPGASGDSVGSGTRPRTRKQGSRRRPGGRRREATRPRSSARPSWRSGSSCAAVASESTLHA